MQLCSFLTNLFTFDILGCAVFSPRYLNPNILSGFFIVDSIGNFSTNWNEKALGSLIRNNLIGGKDNKSLKSF